MTTDEIYTRAYELQHQIKDAEDKLAELNEEYEDLIRQITRENLVSDGMYLRPRKEPSRHAVVSVFREQYPEFYAKCAHPSHAKAVAIMTAIHGDYQGFCNYMRQTQPEMFDKFAELTITDIKKEFTAEEVKLMETCGAIKADEVKSWEICPKPVWMYHKKQEAARE